MDTYTHILLPTDFSRPSIAAAARVRGLVEKLGAQLTVVHVVDYAPPNYVMLELPPGFDSNQTITQRAEEALVRWATDNALEQYPRLLKQGSPRKEILETAKEVGADLIVMGTHGMHALDRVLGSTTNAVMHQACCDVLTTHAAG